MRFFRNKVAIVTGASSGIGRSTALLLARRGATVVASGRNVAHLESLVNEIRSFGGKATYITADVSDRQQVSRIVDETIADHGFIDIVVCSAGIYVRRPARESRMEDFERCFAVNFLGAVTLIQGVLPHMLERRSGSIVVVSSVDAKKGLPHDAPYVASKAALTGYMDVLRQELHGSGVSACTVLPGRVDTPMIEHIRVPAISRKIPSARVASVIVRAIRRNRAEVVVPWAGPSFLILMGTLLPTFADWLVRTTKLEGWELRPDVDHSLTSPAEIVRSRTRRNSPDPDSLHEAKQIIGRGRR